MANTTCRIGPKLVSPLPRDHELWRQQQHLENLPAPWPWHHHGLPHAIGSRSNGGGGGVLRVAFLYLMGRGSLQCVAIRVHATTFSPRGGNEPAGRICSSTVGGAKRGVSWSRTNDVVVGSRWSLDCFDIAHLSIALSLFYDVGHGGEFLAARCVAAQAASWRPPS